MSKELADKFERDLSASDETQEQARRARRQGAALDVDWADAFETYRARANQDRKEFVRFPVAGPLSSTLDRTWGDSEDAANQDERNEPATPR
jgi:hypothetical protein